MLKEEIMRALREYFEGLKGTDPKRVEWELDNVIYPYIGSYIASGELSKEDGKEIFEFCERMLRRLKDEGGGR